MGRPKDVFVTAALELAFAVHRCADRLKVVDRSLSDPPLRTLRGGEVLERREPGGWVSRADREGEPPLTNLVLSPGVVTERDDPDFGMPRIPAMASRMMVAEELLDAIAQNEELAAAVKRYPTMRLTKDAERRMLRHANLVEELPRVVEVDEHLQCLDDDEVFWRLRESLIALSSSYAGFTETKARSRALDRLRPGRVRRPRVKSEKAVWLGHAHAAACTLGLYDSGVEAFARAYRERRMNPP